MCQIEIANKLYRVSNLAKYLVFFALVVAGTSCKSPVAPKPAEGDVVGAQVVGVCNMDSKQLSCALDLEGENLAFYNRHMFSDELTDTWYEIGDTVWFHYSEMPTGMYGEVFVDQVEDPSIQPKDTLDYWRERQRKIYNRDK